MIKHTIVIQRVFKTPDIPSNPQIKKWVTMALRDQTAAREVTVRIVDETEMTHLNETYRKKQGLTNILSFPCSLPKGITSPTLGDIVLCAPVIAEQADKFQISIQSHWAHLIVHGTLHLLGYNHMNPEEAATMEQLEIDLLTQLGFNNPYTNESTYHDG